MPSSDHRAMSVSQAVAEKAMMLPVFGSILFKASVMATTLRQSLRLVTLSSIGTQMRLSVTYVVRSSTVLLNQGDALQFPTLSTFFVQ
jgi:hypothetical protein